MPFVAEKYRDYESFAKATLTQVLEGKMEGAIEKKVTEFRSGLLKNTGDRFEFEPFPAEAQLAPIYAICVEDINKDGRPDLFYGGNYHNREVENGAVGCRHWRDTAWCC